MIIESLIYLCLFVGVIKLSEFIATVYKLIKQHYFRKAQDHYKKYAIGEKNTWIAITGGSDGIGLAFCHHLAKSGFNICIIGRSESKIQEKLVEIKKTNPSIQTDYVIADLGKLANYNDYEKIANQLKNKDIGMVFLNAGWGDPRRFDELQNTVLEEMVNLDALHLLHLTKALLPQLLSRPQKSAIVYTSSSLGLVLAPGNLTYSCAKRFTSYLSRGLAVELKDKLDFLSFEPFGVASNLVKTKPTRTINTAEFATECALRDLGQEDGTFGSLSHYLQYYFVMYGLTTSKRMKFMYHFYTKQFHKKYSGEPEAKK
eukprot:403342545